MFSKISNWFLSSDEKFFSAVKDESKRKEYLNKYYRSRLSITFFLVFLILAVYMGIFWDSTSFTLSMLVLLVSQMMLLMDIESRIRTIRLYEILSAEHRQI